MERTEFEEVEPLLAHGDALGVGEGVGDGQTHVGQTELRLDSPVFKFHSRVHDALRMHHDFNILGRDAIEPVRLDHFKALVHIGCRVDSDFRAHGPVGVLQRLRGGHAAELFLRERAERTARSREQDFANGACLADNTLQNGGMLAVDWQNGHVVV